MKNHFAVLSVSLLLAACGESAEDAYTRGYEEGIIEICNEVRSISDPFYERLRSDRVCF